MKITCRLPKDSKVVIGAAVRYDSIVIGHLIAAEILEDGYYEAELEIADEFGERLLGFGQRMSISTTTV